MRFPRVAWPAVLLAVLVVGCVAKQPTEVSKLTLDIRGSDTMVNLGAALAEAFMADNPHVELVVQGGGSGTGIAALLDRNADICQSSRAMKREEWEEARRRGLDVKEIVVGYDSIAVCVHPGNPVSELTLQQLAAIYRGEIRRWSEVGGRDEPIVVLSRDTASGTHAFFKEAVVQEGGARKGAEFGPDVMMLPSTQSIVDETRQNPRAIGYIGLGYLDHTVKALAIGTEGGFVRPSSQATEGYPLSRPLYFYVVGEPEGALRDYLDFVLGPRGQEIVEKSGFLPASR